MFCGNCGAQNNDNAMFCANCGGRLTVQQQNVGMNAGGNAYVGANNGYGGTAAVSITPEYKKHLGVRVTAAIFAFLVALMPLYNFVRTLIDSGEYIFRDIEYLLDTIFYEFLPVLSAIMLGIFIIAAKKQKIMVIPFSVWLIEVFCSALWYWHYIINYDLFGSFYTIAYIIADILIVTAVLCMFIGTLAKPLLKAWWAFAILVLLVQLCYMVLNVIDIIRFLDSFFYSPESFIMDIIYIPYRMIYITFGFLLFYGVYRLAYPAKVVKRAPAVYQPHPAASYAGQPVNGYAPAVNNAYQNGAYQNVQNSGYQNVQNSGYQNVQNSGYQNVQNSGYQNVQNSGYQNVQNSGYQNVQNSGYQNVQNSGYQNVQNTPYQNVAPQTQNTAYQNAVPFEAVTSENNSNQNQ